MSPNADNSRLPSYEQLCKLHLKIERRVGTKDGLSGRLTTVDCLPVFSTMVLLVSIGCKKPLGGYKAFYTLNHKNMTEFIEEKMSDLFTKFHLKGLPFDAVIHKFTEIHGENAHSHPFRFQSFVLKGGYTERIYYIGGTGKGWLSKDVFRAPGSSHFVEADTIHEIIDLPNGECYTLILPEAKVQEPAFYKFEEGAAYKRFWYENEFTKI